MKTYSAQINSHGNVIIFAGNTKRKSHKVGMIGTYQACLKFKGRCINGAFWIYA